MTRRCFLGGMVATAGATALAKTGKGGPDLKVGIVSDVHLSRPEKHNSQGAIDMFRKVLTFFKTEKVDAVLIAGDLTNGGTTDEIRVGAEVWSEVFGSLQAGPVKVFVTGNHEKVYVNEAPTCWQEVWGEPWQPFVFKVVKGYAFVGANWAEWMDAKALTAFLRAHDAQLRTAKPFFYTQHAHPQNTCYGPWTWHQKDGGKTAEILSDYPNAVAFSGHTHYPLTDERSIWQGGFTSLGTGSLRWLTAPDGRENGPMPKNVGSRMKQMVWGGAQGMVMSVWGDEIVFERYDFTNMEKLGDDWVVPVLHGAADERRYAFAKRAAASVAPEFPAGAAVKVATCRGKDPKGVEEDQVEVSFPAVVPQAGVSRVMDYEVTAEIPLADSDVVRTLCVKRIYQPGMMYAARRDTAKELKCVFGRCEFQGLPCRFVVQPLNWFGKGGRRIVSACLKAMAAVALLLPGAFSAEAAYEKEGPAPIVKKYVAFGWEFGQATPEQLLKVADSLDRTALNGIGIYLNVTNAAGRRVDKLIMHAPAYDWKDLAPSVPAYRALTRHKSMKETFFKSFCAPTNRLDWTDDATWARLATSMRMLARLAKQGGLKGLSVDDEDYHNQRLFKRLPGERPMDELAELVRRRAREVFAPAFEEYPDMTVFLFRFFTAGKAYPGCSDPMGARAATGDLWPSFLNGMLDVLPPGGKLVDGYEESYVFDSLKSEYLRGYVHEKSRLVNMATPSNRTKYLTQVSSSMAIYLDMYCNPEGSTYYSAPLYGTRFGHLAANLEQVTHVVDEYVWFWGEKQCWSDWSAAARKLPRNIASNRWTQTFPQLTETMEILKDPDGYAARRLAEIRSAGSFAPLNANPTCARSAKAKDDKLAAPYSGWSNKRVGPEGRFFFDSTVGENDATSLAAEGVASGCITMSVRNLKAGETYLAGFSAKGEMTSGMIYWFRDGKWDFTIPGIAVNLSDPDARGWRHGVTAFRIPPEADGFGLQMGVCQAPGEKCWFDNVFYVRAQ